MAKPKKYIIEKKIKDLSEFGLNNDETTVYMKIWEKEGNITPSILKKELGWSENKIQRVLNSLVEKHFIEEKIENLYVAKLPIEGIDVSLSQQIQRLYKIKEEIINELQIYKSWPVIGYNIRDPAIFSEIVKNLAGSSPRVLIRARDLTFYDDIQNQTLDKLKILISFKIDEEGDIEEDHVRELQPKMKQLYEKGAIIRYNASNIELRYMVTNRYVLLVEKPENGEHKKAILIEGDDFIGFFEWSFDREFSNAKKYKKENANEIIKKLEKKEVEIITIPRDEKGRHNVNYR